MNLDEAAAEMKRLSRLLDAGLVFLREQSEAFGDAEQAYREGTARAWLVAEGDSVPARKAWVEGRTARDRRARDVADGMRQAALEAVRSRRGQLSAWQSYLAADRAEAEFARTGPTT